MSGDGGDAEGDAELPDGGCDAGVTVVDIPPQPTATNAATTQAKLRMRETSRCVTKQAISQ